MADRDPAAIRSFMAKIAVGGEEYEVSALCTALSHTGIKRIETELEKLLTSTNKENK